MSKDCSVRPQYVNFMKKPDVGSIARAYFCFSLGEVALIIISKLVLTRR